jgi:hypothetical protein
VPLGPQLTHEVKLSCFPMDGEAQAWRKLQRRDLAAGRLEGSHKSKLGTGPSPLSAGGAPKESRDETLVAQILAMATPVRLAHLHYSPQYQWQRYPHGPHQQRRQGR